MKLSQGQLLSMRLRAACSEDPKLANAMRVMEGATSALVMMLRRHGFSDSEVKDVMDAVCRHRI